MTPQQEEYLKLLREVSERLRGTMHRIQEAHGGTLPFSAEFHETANDTHEGETDDVWESADPDARDDPRGSRGTPS